MLTYIQTLFLIIVTFLTIVGWSSFCYSKFFKDLSLENLSDHNSWFGASYAISWFLSLGLIGLITSLSFYLNLPFNYAHWFVLIIGLMLFFIHYFKKMIFFPKFIKLITNEIKNQFAPSVLIFIAIFFIIYLIRTTIMWWDQDEITQYGYFSKLIASGWTYDNFTYFTGDGGTKFAEGLGAFFFKLNYTTIPIRIMKWVNLFFISVLLYFTGKLFKIDKSILQFSPVILLGTPELSYLATSLKVDSLLMAFEFSSLALLSILLYFKEKKPIPFFIVCLISYMAVATRLSGAYIATLCTIAFLYKLFFVSSSLRLKLYSLSIWILSALFFAHPYIKSFEVFNNPIFPFTPPWKEAISYIDISYWKSFCNLILNAPVGIYQIYLLIHTSLGLETSIYNRFDFIPHALHKGVSLGWLNPILILLISFPLIFYKRRELKIIGSLFWILFFIWSKGIQLTRVILGLNTFGILYGISCLNYFYSKGLKKVIPILLFLLSNVLLIYQISFSYRKMPLNPFLVFTAKGKYDITKKSISNSHQTHFTKQETNSYLSFKDVNWFNNYLAQNLQIKTFLLVGFQNESVLTFFHPFLYRGYFKTLPKQSSINAIESHVQAAPYFKDKNFTMMNLMSFDCTIISSTDTFTPPSVYQLVNVFDFKHKLFCKQTKD